MGNRPGFYRHVREAIRLNSERRPVYARLSQGRSAALSRHLIWTETLCLAPALWFDWQARPFNQQGIQVVRDDFVSMDNLPEPDTAPRFTGKAAPDTVQAVRELLDEFRGQAENLTTDISTSGELCRAAERTLDRIEDMETRVQAHFAMSRHLVESIGYAALNAPGYARASDQQSWPLSRRLILFQSRGLRSSVGMDVQAQSSHMMNVGILVNDLPAIPFAS